jgi:hypothetical protein
MKTILTLTNIKAISNEEIALMKEKELELEIKNLNSFLINNSTKLELSKKVFYPTKPSKNCLLHLNKTGWKYEYHSEQVLEEFDGGSIGTKNFIEGILIFK